MEPQPLSAKLRRKKDREFKSFFNKSPQHRDQTNSDVEDVEQLAIEAQKCSVCRSQLGSKKRQCGVCTFNACSQHLRKKRRDKTGKWVRICDDCEDKFLFESYMKYELKAEEAIVMQEQIVLARKKDMDDRVNGKQSKILVLNKEAEDSKQRHNQTHKKIMVNHNQIDKKLTTQDVAIKEADDFEAKLRELEKSLPRSLEDDFNSLKIQDEKITKELVKLQKRCNELIQTISQREKDIHSAYDKWEQSQKLKKKDQEQKCKVS